MATDSVIENLGFGAAFFKNVDLVEVKKEIDTPTVKEIIQKWGDDLIHDLQDSLERETSTETSKDLWHSIKGTPSQVGKTLVWTLTMLDYYDFINKGVEGSGGHPLGKKPTLKVYRFDSQAIKDTPKLRQWASTKRITDIFPLRRSIAQRGIEKTEWYDKVVTQERVNKLIEGVAEAGAEQLAVGLKLVLENGNNVTN